MHGGEAKPRLVSLGEDMTTDQRRAYERDCLEELKQRLAYGTRPHPGDRDVREIALVGKYPETAIHVKWFDPRYETEGEADYHLWVSPVTGEPHGVFELRGSTLVGREPPDQVAMLIDTWIQER
jgi:hypothetical protein